MKLLALAVPAAAIAAVTGNHNLFVWGIYTFGQILHTATKADAAADAAGPGNYKAAFKAYLWRNRRSIVARKFLGFCLFPIVWDNPELVGLTDLFEKLGSAALVGAAGIVGWFSDSIGDRLFARWAWLKAETNVPASAPNGTVSQ